MDFVGAVRENEGMYPRFSITALLWLTAYAALTIAGFLEPLSFWSRVQFYFWCAVVLRIAVNGGGCQGFEYSFALESAKKADDIVFEKDGVTVLIDEMSLDLLAGSTIDFVDEMAGAAFKIKNPNAKSNCGCGTSFSI